MYPIFISAIIQQYKYLVHKKRKKILVCRVEDIFSSKFRNTCFLVRLALKKKKFFQLKIKCNLKLWSKVLETICKYIIFQFGKIENKPFSLKKSGYLFTKKKYNGCYNGWLPLCHLCHLRHRLRNFLFRTKVMFRSQDIQVLALLTIP